MSDLGVPEEGVKYSHDRVKMKVKVPVCVYHNIQSEGPPFLSVYYNS